MLVFMHPAFKRRVSCAFVVHPTIYSALIYILYRSIQRLRLEAKSPMLTQA